MGHDFSDYANDHAQRDEDDRRLLEGMGKRNQLFLHDPANEIYGDCYRTCIANLLGYLPADVPHFAEMAFKSGEPDRDFAREWLRKKGYGLIATSYVDCSLAQILGFYHVHAAVAPWILSGKSRNGTNHSVLCQGGDIWHDSSIDKSGIVGPCSDGMFWAEFIVYVNRPNKHLPIDYVPAGR